VVVEYCREQVVMVQEVMMEMATILMVVMVALLITQVLTMQVVTTLLAVAVVGVLLAVQEDLGRALVRVALLV
jgi:hypothetical protein